MGVVTSTGGRSPLHPFKTLASGRELAVRMPCMLFFASGLETRRRLDGIRQMMHPGALPSGNDRALTGVNLSDTMSYAPRARPSPSAASLSRASTACAYTANVTEGLAWPSRAATVLGSIPCPTISVALR